MTTHTDHSFAAIAADHLDRVSGGQAQGLKNRIRAAADDRQAKLQLAQISKCEWDAPKNDFGQPDSDAVDKCYRKVLGIK